MLPTSRRRSSTVRSKLLSNWTALMTVIGVVVACGLLLIFVLETDLRQQQGELLREATRTLPHTRVREAKRPVTEEVPLVQWQGGVPRSSASGMSDDRSGGAVSRSPPSFRSGHLVCGTCRSSDLDKFPFYYSDDGPAAVEGAGATADSFGLQRYYDLTSFPGRAHLQCGLIACLSEEGSSEVISHLTNDNAPKRAQDERVPCPLSLLLQESDPESTSSEQFGEQVQITRAVLPPPCTSPYSPLQLDATVSDYTCRRFTSNAESDATLRPEDVTVYMFSMHPFGAIRGGEAAWQAVRESVRVAGGSTVHSDSESLDSSLIGRYQCHAVVTSQSSRDGAVSFLVGDSWTFHFPVPLPAFIEPENSSDCQRIADRCGGPGANLTGLFMRQRDSTALFLSRAQTQRPKSQTVSSHIPVHSSSDSKKVSVHLHLLDSVSRVSAQLAFLSNLEFSSWITSVDSSVDPLVFEFGGYSSMSHSTVFLKRALFLGLTTVADTNTSLFRAARARGYSTQVVDFVHTFASSIYGNDFIDVVDQAQFFDTRLFQGGGQDGIDSIYQHSDPRANCLFGRPRQDVLAEIVRNDIPGSPNSFRPSLRFIHEGGGHTPRSHALRDTVSNTLTTLKHTFAQAEKFNQPLVYILFADHGNAYSAERNTRFGQLNHQRPLLWIFASKNALSAEARRNLILNRDRLVTMTDIRALVLDLIGDSTPMSPSLLREQFRWDRSCGDAKIPPEFCSCAQRRRPLDLSAAQMLALRRSLTDFVNVVELGLPESPGENQTTNQCPRIYPHWWSVYSVLELETTEDDRQEGGSAPLLVYAGFSISHLHNVSTGVEPSFLSEAAKREDMVFFFPFRKGFERKNELGWPQYGKALHDLTARHSNPFCLSLNPFRR